MCPIAVCSVSSTGSPESRSNHKGTRADAKLEACHQDASTSSRRDRRIKPSWPATTLDVIDGVSASNGVRGSFGGAARSSATSRIACHRRAPCCLDVTSCRSHPIPALPIPNVRSGKPTEHLAFDDTTERVSCLSGAYLTRKIVCPHHDVSWPRHWKTLTAQQRDLTGCRTRR